MRLRGNYNPQLTRELVGRMREALHFIYWLRPGFVLNLGSANSSISELVAPFLSYEVLSESRRLRAGPQRRSTICFFHTLSDMNDDSLLAPI